MGGQTHLECLAEVGGELDTDDGLPVVSNHHHRVKRVEGHMGQLGALLLYHWERWGGEEEERRRNRWERFLPGYETTEAQTFSHVAWV